MPELSSVRFHGDGLGQKREIKVGPVRFHGDGPLGFHLPCRRRYNLSSRVK